jgi:hypothetical protein
MPVFNLYSKRQKRLRGELPDVFQYDSIPAQLRVQIIHIWRDTVGEDRFALDPTPAADTYKEISNVLCREYGIFDLVRDSRGYFENDLERYFLSLDEHEKALDVIELVFRFIDLVVRDEYHQSNTLTKLKPDAAIEELNARLLEHGVGYQYNSGQLIRKDSELLHANVVKPALEFLQDELYEGANEEFLRAHDHYRHGRYKESLNECLKAFESTMKSICNKRGWAYSEKDTAKKLIDICLANGLIPAYLQSQIQSLKSILESGIPTVRNRLGGHGQGGQQTTVPNYMASYTIHMTATTILLLIEAENEVA